MKADNARFSLCEHAGREKDNLGWQTDTSKEISVFVNVMLDKL